MERKSRTNATKSKHLEGWNWNQWLRAQASSLFKSRQWMAALTEDARDSRGLDKPPHPVQVVHFGCLWLHDASWPSYAVKGLQIWKRDFKVHCNISGHCMHTHTHTNTTEINRQVGIVRILNWFAVFFLSVRRHFGVFIFALLELGTAAGECHHRWSRLDRRGCQNW